MTSSNEAEAVIRIRAKNEASKDLNEISGQVSKLERFFGRFKSQIIGTGLAMFGTSISMRSMIQAGDATAAQAAKTTGSLALMSEKTQSAFAELSTHFEDIADDLGTTTDSVNEVARVITTASGGIVPSVDEIRAAFDIASASGSSLEDAANAVGKALEGNEEPLNNLLDPSGRSYISLNKAMEDLSGNFEDNRTSSQKFFSEFSDFMAQAGRDFDKDLGPLIDKLTSGLRGIEHFFHSSDDELNKFFDDLKKLNEHAEEYLQPFIDAGVIPPIDFGGLKPVPDLPPDQVPPSMQGEMNFAQQSAYHPGTTDLSSGGGFLDTSLGGMTINIYGNVDSEITAEKMARDIASRIQNNNRRGVNVSA